MKIKNFFVKGKRRFQKTYGNTYHSVEIYGMVDNKLQLLGSVPFSYGYGDQYKQTAKQRLHENGYIEKVENKIYTDYNFEDIEIQFSVDDVDRKKDL